MQRLLERYIEPLRDDTKLLPADTIESLYVTVKSIHQLQQTFLTRLESNIPTEVLAYNAIHEFRVSDLLPTSIINKVLLLLGYPCLNFRNFSFLFSIF